MTLGPIVPAVVHELNVPLTETTALGCERIQRCLASSVSPEIVGYIRRLTSTINLWPVVLIGSRYSYAIGTDVCVRVCVYM